MPDLPTAPQPQVNRRFLVQISLIAALGGLLYGFDMGIIAASIIFVKHTFTLSTVMEEVVVSVVLVGTMIGAVVGGTVADRIGRRTTLVWAAVMFVVGSVLAALSPNVEILIAARTLIGIAIGFTSVTAPLYVSELAPPQSRGALIGLYQFALTIGIALSDGVGYWLAPHSAWRGMFGIGVLPALVLFVAILTVPESPRWLFAKNRLQEATSVLRSYTDELGARQFLSDIRSGLEVKTEERWSALWSPAVRGALFIGVGLTVLQQITGINTIIYYGPQIFELAGVSSHSSAILATLIVALVNVLATVVALVLVDRVGRKPLLYIGVSGMTIALFVLSFAFSNKGAVGASLGAIVMTCLIGYIACFAFSLGPIVWILVSEVFPLRVRGRGIAAATLGCGLANSIVSLTFLSLINAIGGSGVFAIYGAVSVLTLIFIRFAVPETRGRELESISRETAATRESMRATTLL